MYKEIWTPVLQEVLKCEREPINLYDKHAVKVTKAGEIVGHLPKPFSKYCTLILLSTGTIQATVI